MAYIAASLQQLRDEVDARWPGRDRTSDGAIGDTSHQARVSDHNPSPPVTGVVRARDFDKDGMDPWRLVAVACADDRTSYVIHAGRIWQRTSGFASRPYTGPNAHLGHVHVSIRHGAQFENDRSPWGIATTGTVSDTTPGRGTVPTITRPPAPTPIEERDDMANEGPEILAMMRVLEQNLFRDPTFGDVRQRLDDVRRATTARPSAVVYLVWSRDGGIYEADIAAGTVHRVLDPTDHKDRITVLDRLGIPWSWWKGTPQAATVDNLEAFGRLVA